MGYVGDVRQQHANCYIYSIIACHHLHVRQQHIIYINRLTLTHEYSHSNILQHTH